MRRTGQSGETPHTSRNPGDDGQAAASRAQPDDGLPLREPLERVFALEPLLRMAAGLSVGAIVVCALYFGRGLLVPLALAAFLGFLLDPLVTRLKRWGLPRALAAVIVTGAAVCVIVGIAVFVVAQLRALSAELPTYQDNIQAKVVELRQRLQSPSDWDGALSTLRVVSDEIEEATQPEEQPVAGKAQPVVMAESGEGPVRTALAWMLRISGPVVTAGIVLLFVVLILIDRDRLHDRLLRLMGGGNLHLATDALREAGTRIGRYLRMQFVVNACYGVPLGVGLYFIGVPGAVLWGVLAIVLRFLPYLGPLLCAVFPLLLAFAVDPGWSMVLWTLGLIVGLELLCNNVFEPWLYGSSTGLSPLAVIVAAMFWTAIWGPVGLVLATPLTVCLLVLGRHVPRLSFFATLLGSAPVLDAPNRLYQRLLAGNVTDAVELATEMIDAAGTENEDPRAVAEAVLSFYDGVAFPALRVASAHHTSAATARHRLHLATGMGELVQELRDAWPPAEPECAADAPRIVCLGARWQVDALAARMLVHVLELHGLGASAVEAVGGRFTSADFQPPLRPGDIVCISIFHPEPKPQLRLLARRLRRLQPQVRILVLAWTGAADVVPGPGGADVQAGSIRQLLHYLDCEWGLLPAVEAGGETAPLARGDGPRMPMDASLLARHRELVRQVADAFDVAHVQIGWIDGEGLVVTASTLEAVREGGLRIAMADTACRLVVESGQPVVIGDVQQDARVTSLPAFADGRIRFYAGVPLEDPRQGVLGSLCLMDTRPGSLDDGELALLRSMADRVLADLRET